MAIVTVWQGDVGDGMRLKLDTTSGGVTATLQRRTVLFDAAGKPEAGWLIHSQIGVWWPSSAEEAKRLLGHWLDFYDATLRAHLRPLLDAMAAIPEAAGGAPPQPQSMN